MSNAATIEFSRTSNGTFALPPSWSVRKMLINGAREVFIVVFFGLVGLLDIAFSLAYWLITRLTRRQWALVANRILTLGLVVMLGVASVWSYDEAKMKADEAISVVNLSPAINRELACLSTTLYWEGQRGNEVDQRGIARNIFTRMASGRYPSTACGVVNEVRTKPNGTKVAMYSYIFDNRPAPSGREWQNTRRIAAEELTTWYAGQHIEGSTNYIAPYASSDWSTNGVANCKMSDMGQIGFHLHFADLSPAQARDCRTYRKLLADKVPDIAPASFIETPATVQVPKYRPVDKVSDLIASL